MAFACSIGPRAVFKRRIKSHLIYSLLLVGVSFPLLHGQRFCPVSFCSSHSGPNCQSWSLEKELGTQVPCCTWELGPMHLLMFKSPEIHREPLNSTGFPHCCPAVDSSSLQKNAGARSRGNDCIIRPTIFKTLQQVEHYCWTVYILIHEDN